MIRNCLINAERRSLYSGHGKRNGRKGGKILLLLGSFIFHPDVTAALFAVKISHIGFFNFRESNILSIDTLPLCIDFYTTKISLRLNLGKLLRKLEKLHAIRSYFHVKISRSEKISKLLQLVANIKVRNH